MQTKYLAYLTERVYVLGLEYKEIRYLINKNYNFNAGCSNAIIHKHITLN